MSPSFPSAGSPYDIQFQFPNDQQIDQQIVRQIRGQLIDNHPTMVKIIYDAPQPSFSENFSVFGNAVASLRLDPALFPIFEENG